MISMIYHVQLKDLLIQYPNDTYATVDINRDQRLVDAGLPAVC